MREYCREGLNLGKRNCRDMWTKSKNFIGTTCMLFCTNMFHLIT